MVKPTVGNIKKKTLPEVETHKKELPTIELGSHTSSVREIRGLDGKDGTTPTEEELLLLIEPLIPEPIPGIDGIDGKDGEDGEDGEDGQSPAIEDFVDLIASLIPEPIKGDKGIAGAKGRDGKDMKFSDLTIAQKNALEGPRGVPGSNGQGVPIGGTAGQVLAKINDTNFNAEWINVSGGGAVDSVNTKTGVVVLDTSDIADTTNKRYVTDVEKTKLSNTSGTNTGDNAVNTLYSGLAASKQNVLTLTTTGSSGSATLVSDVLNIPNYAGSVTTYPVAQTAHGLSVGNVIKSTGANTYGKAQADSAANAEVVGFVTAVADVNNFTFSTPGIITLGVPAQAAGTVMFLDPTTAGGLTVTEPTTVGQISKPLFVILQNGTKALFQIFRGMEIEDAGAVIVYTKISAKKSSNQSLSNGTTDITFNTEEFDTKNEFATNVFTAAASGYYNINCSLSYTPPADQASIQVYIYKNTSTLVGTSGVRSSGSSDATIAVSKLLYLNSADTIKISCYVSGSTTISNDTGTFLQIIGIN